MSEEKFDPEVITINIGQYHIIYGKYVTSRNN